MSAPPAIHVGTSGYSFADWVGPFYPPGTKSGDFLAHYARHFGFDTCVIPFLFTQSSRKRHVMAYVEKKYGPCKFLLFKQIPDFHQDLDHFPKPAHYDRGYQYADHEWRPPDTIHVITTPWQRVGFPDFHLIGENP